MGKCTVRNIIPVGSISLQNKNFQRDHIIMGKTRINHPGHGFILPKNLLKRHI